MRPFPLVSALLFLPLAAALAAANAELHTFTDTFGRTFSGAVTEATDASAKVRREDGQVFTLDLAKLTEADVAYVAKWRREHQAFTLRVETSQFHTPLGSNQARDPGSVEQNIAAGYDIKVTNAAAAPAANLRVEYNVFAMQYNFELYTVETSIGNGYPSSGSGRGNNANNYVLEQRVRRNGPPVPVRIKGSAPLDLAAFKASPLIRTGPLNYFKHSTLRSTSNGGSLDYETGELQGVWVRVFSGDKVVAEFVSNESLRSQGWQEVGTKVAVAATDGR
jgi:hypothetical protein